MLDLAQAPELPTEAEAAIDTAGDDMFANLHRDLQAAKVKKLTAYFAKTPTAVVRVTETVSGLVLLHLSKCWNKPEEHDGGDPCVCVRPDGSYFYRCQHKNCAGLTWKDVEDVYGPRNPPPEVAKAPAVKVLTCKQLADQNFRLRYLIDDLWVADHAGFFSGGMKDLKTTVAVNAGISLATATPFLERFHVPQPCRVLMASGESGIATLQEIAFRICAAKGVCLPDIDNLFWTDWLPMLTSAKHLERLEQTIQDTGCEVLILDPVYLMMPGADASNLMIQGERLRPLSELCQRHRVTPILLHHTRKRGKGDRSYEPPELSDLAWAGFGEFARQWLLLGRREPYQPGSGEHRLWLSAGGSAGHGGLWAIDVDEGPSGQPRHWKVSLSTPSEAREEKKENTVRQRILDAAREFAQGETKTGILTVAKVKSDTAVRAIFDSLVNEGLLIPCKVKKGAAGYDGFRLATHEASPCTT